MDDLKSTPRSIPPGAWRFGPSSLISAALALLILVNIACAFFAARPAYLGFRMEPEFDIGGLELTLVRPNSPMDEAGFQVGDILVSIDSDLASATPLHPYIAIPDPNFLETQADVRAVMKLHGETAVHMKADEVRFQLSDGTVRDVKPSPSRPLSQLLRDDRFIAPMVIGNFAFLVGVLFWVYRRREPALRLLLLMGIANAIVLWTPAIGWVQELAVTEFERRAFFALNQFSTMSHAFILLCLLLIYPTRLLGWRWIGVMAISAFLLWLNCTFHFVALPTRVLLWYFLILTALAALAIILQLIRTRLRPIERAQASLIALCVLLTTSAVLGVYVVPIILTGASLGGEIWVSSLVSTLPLFGFGLGITRFRLFDLPTWWFHASIWLLSGFLIAIVEFGLFFLLGLRHISSLAISTLAVGWIYFPIRQALFHRLVRTRQRRLSEILPDYLTRLSEARTASDFDLQLVAETKRLFSPAELITVPHAIDRVSIENSGLKLLVPSTVEGHSLELEAASNGTRLFNSIDVKLATVIFDITQRYRVQIESIEKVVKDERQRIARDLHDSVGAKLVTLIHGAPSRAVSQQARDVTGALKDTIWLLRSDDAQSLELAISKWSGEARTRCDEAEIDLVWRQEPLGKIMLPALHLVSLGNIVREALTNVIRHSEATHLSVAISLDMSRNLRLRLKHNGAKSRPEDWRPGFGMLGIEERVTELGGAVNWSSDPLEEDLVSMDVNIPVKEHADGE